MHGARSGNWFVDALQSAVGGLLFAVIIATAIVVMQALGVHPIRLVEQWGIDAGMMLYANLGFSEEATERPPDKLQYAFIDVDSAACELFLDRQRGSDCRTSNPVRTRLLADLMKSLRASKAAVVVVDVTPPGAEERKAWQDALVASDGPWVIAPIFSRPGSDCDGLSIQGDHARDIVESHAEGRLRLASVGTFVDPELGDGILRHFPVASRLHEDGQPTRWVPTVPYLAAQLGRAAQLAPELASAKTREIDTRYFGKRETEAGARPSIDCHPLAAQSVEGLKPIPSDNFFDPTDLGRVPPIVRFFFSLPALSALDDSQRRRAEWRKRFVYQRYEAGLLIDPAGCAARALDPLPRCFTTRPDLFEGKVVVVGTSSMTALDRIQTPVGAMSGAELVLNATRAFAEFPMLKEPTFPRMLLKKIGGLLVPAAMLLCAWMAIYAIRARFAGVDLHRFSPRKRRWMIRLLRWSRNILVVFVFFLGMTAAALFELDKLIPELTHELGRVDTNAEPVDVLLPILALGLEAYTEAAKQTERLLHVVAHKLVALLMYWSTRAAGVLRRRIARTKRWRDSASKRTAKHKEPKP